MVGFVNPKTIWRHRGGRAHFPPKMVHFFKSDLGAILDVLSIDNGPLSNHKQFQLDWSKNGRVMAEKRMPIYGHMRVIRGQFWPITWPNIDIFQ